MFIVIVAALLLAVIAGPMVYFYAGEKTAKRGKQALAGNLISFFLVAAAASAFIFTNRAYAAETVSGAGEWATAAAYLGAALVTGLCCIGTGIATGSAASAAIGAISENEKVMGKAIIFVGMAEGIAIYGLLISFMILGRV